MPAAAQDAWDERVTESGITEPRWVRAIEIRPSALKGRKITHHAIAYLEQDDPGATRSLLPVPFMEWAVGKQGELMRPDTGKLLLPGSKFRWDIHYSQAGEEITSNVEMGIYFYPKGEVPKYRNNLSLVPAALGTLDIRPNTIAVNEGFFPLRDNARIESFQPHMHLRGKAMMVEAVLPSGQRQVLSHVDNFNFQWMTTFVYADDVAPLLPKGTLLKVTAWHDNTVAKTQQSRSEPVGRLGRSHRRRDGARVDQHRLPERRRVQGRGREAQDRLVDDLAAVVRPLVRRAPAGAPRTSSDVTDSYVHGYDPEEQQRLQDQAATLADLLHHDTAYPDGSAVLEAGCGVGAQTVILAATSPRAYITSIDISPVSLAEARAAVAVTGAANVTFEPADIFALPFATASFDHVFVCFVLEHLSQPVDGAAPPGAGVEAGRHDHGHRGRPRLHLLPSRQRVRAPCRAMPGRPAGSGAR